MQFLVKYAAQVFPPSPEEANGEVIWQNIVNLQDELTDKRETGIKNLVSALVSYYPEQLPGDVEERARIVARAFQKERFCTKREMNNLSRLAVDANLVFPPDFVSVNGPDICAQVGVRIVCIVCMYCIYA
jgi:hypothetical protein